MYCNISRWKNILQCLLLKNISYEDDELVIQKMRIMEEPMKYQISAVEEYRISIKSYPEGLAFTEMFSDTVEDLIRIDK